MKKKLRVMTTFSGIGMQERGLKNADVYDIEIVGTCETDPDAIVSYAAIHNNLTMEKVENYEEYPTRDIMAKELADMHIGYDFVKDKEYDWQKIARGSDKQQKLRKTWLACKLNKNVGDISRVETFPECDLLVFSFPCTDISIAGAQAGFEEGTRSGLVHQVIRILKNMEHKPKLMLMENVDALINKKNLPGYEALNKQFEELGFNCTYDLMNAKFYGIPQNRNRIFALYTSKDTDMSKFIFPKKFDSGIRLKDIMLDEVDEKYYINNPKAQELIDKLVSEGAISESEY